MYVFKYVEEVRCKFVHIYVVIFYLIFSRYVVERNGGQCFSALFCLEWEIYFPRPSKNHNLRSALRSIARESVLKSKK